MNPHIHIITTGGTIDCAEIDPTNTYHFAQSIIPDMLKKGRNLNTYDWTHLEPIDSLLMTDTYRTRIQDACDQVQGSRILITHGTDTMVETARFLEERNRNKAIVLVGSMIPAREEGSDGEMNLGFALGVLTTLAVPGVYIAMNGQIFIPKNVRKNTEAKIFETLA